jgi:predicted O-methyltransferase YrrM
MDAADGRRFCYSKPAAKTAERDGEHPVNLPKPEELFALVARAADAGVFNINRENLDILKMASVIAAYESARYYIERMTEARAFDQRPDLLKFAVKEATQSGLVLEFGVGPGGSARILAENAGQEIYGFDSFEGLPENWRRGFEKGAFKRTSVPELPPQVRLVKGFFEDTLPGFLSEHPEPLRLVHVDCDLYSSAAFVLEALADRLRSGVVVVFDEYFNFPGWQQHEHRALREFVERTGTAYDYIGFVRAGPQVAIRIG